MQTAHGPDGASTRGDVEADPPTEPVGPPVTGGGDDVALPSSRRASGGEGGLIPDFVDDPEKRARLRRMKAVALSFLFGAAIIWIVFLVWERNGGPAFTGYVRAAAEAGMVGGLADWFAVTALFRHPLGLPIPHTAIIPRKKDQLGASPRASSARTSSPQGRRGAAARRSDRPRGSAPGWPTPGNADAGDRRARHRVRGALTVLRDADVQAVVGQADHPARRRPARRAAGIGTAAGRGRRRRRRTAASST